MTDFFSLCVWERLYCAFSLKDNFTRYSQMGSVFLSTLKYFTLLLSCTVPDENSGVNVIFVPLQVSCFFLLTSFKIFFLQLE